MTHEPECLNVVGPYDNDPSCSECGRLRSAYQRGREKAAEEVVAVIWNSQLTIDGLIDALRAAARGEERE